MIVQVSDTAFFRKLPHIPTSSVNHETLWTHQQKHEVAVSLPTTVPSETTALLVLPYADQSASPQPSPIPLRTGVTLSSLFSYRARSQAAARRESQLGEVAEESYHFKT